VSLLGSDQKPIDRWRNETFGESPWVNLAYGTIPTGCEMQPFKGSSKDDSGSSSSCQVHRDKSDEGVDRVARDFSSLW